MNSYLCLLVLCALANAQLAPQNDQVAPQNTQFFPQNAQFSPQNRAGRQLWTTEVKPASWNEGPVSYVSSVQPSGYWPSYYSPSIYSAEVSPKTYFVHKNQQHSVPVIARSDSILKKVEPVSWTDATYFSQPASWSVGQYSAEVPKVKVTEKQVFTTAAVATAPVAPTSVVSAPVKPESVQPVQPVVDSTPKLFSYSSEITHDVPAKKEEVISAPRSVPAPTQYSAWSGESKPVTEVKPTTYISEVKPATWSSDVSSIGSARVVGTTKPVSYTWSEPKPVGQWAAYTPEVKPASWTSWSEAKPLTSYTVSSPVQPAYYSSSWAQPVVSTNSHHAISAPWSYTHGPVAHGRIAHGPVAYGPAWIDPFQKRSDRPSN